MTDDRSHMVSVIIPCYNAGRFLDACLASVRCQTHKALDVIVVDDGSTDDSVLVADRHAAEDRRVRVVRQSNGGASAARNTGLAHATGTFVTFFDADDVLYPTSVERRLAVFANDPNIDVVYSDHQVINSAGEPLHLSLSLPMSSRPLVDLLVCPCMGPQGVLLRREAIDAVGPFDVSVRHCEDWDYWIRLAEAGRTFYHLREVLCGYRRHDANITRQTDAGLHSFIRMLTKHRPPSQDKAARKAWKRGMYGIFRNWHWNVWKETRGLAARARRIAAMSRTYPGLLTAFPLVIAGSVARRLQRPKVRK